MTSTTYVDLVGPAVNAAWLNDVNGATYNGTGVYTPGGTGAVPTTVQTKLRESVSVKDFGAKGDGISDDTAAINLAISAAYSLSLGQIVTPYDNIKLGGTEVIFPPGKYLTTSGSIFLRDGVKLKGAGKFATVISSTYNGAIIGTGTPYGYDMFGMGIEDLSIIGDRTKANQIGVDLLREWQGSYKNVSVSSCGSHGWRLRQCVMGSFDTIEGMLCKGSGIYIADGTASLLDMTPNNLPSNNVVLTNTHFYGNDGAGIILGRIGSSGTSCNAIQFIGGGAEYNYASSAAGLGANIEIACASYAANIFTNFTCEDNKVLTHAYINLADSASTVKFINFIHLASGAAAYPQKAIIVEKGILLLEGAESNNAQYKTYLGSNAPFQITKATASARINNSSGNTSATVVVDETGASTGLENQVRISSYGVHTGPTRWVTDFGEGGPDYYQSGQAYPYVSYSTFYKGIQFGSGTVAPSETLAYSSPGILSLSGTLLFDGATGKTVKYTSGTANAAVATTLGSVGPTGSTAGNPQGWLRINVAGFDRFIPYW